MSLLKNFSRSDLFSAPEKDTIHVLENIAARSRPDGNILKLLTVRCSIANMAVPRWSIPSFNIAGRLASHPRGGRYSMNVYGRDIVCLLHWWGLVARVCLFSSLVVV
jgi:hypothetical protein